MNETAPVVYLGPAGTFAEMAVAALGLTESARPATSVVAALDQVRTGEASAAVVPIENSIEGSVSGTLDEIAAGPVLRIVQEVTVPVLFALMRPQGQSGPIEAIGTHPVAAAQCRRWIHTNAAEARVVLTSSTAGAAEALAAGTASFDAAVAPTLAAQRYGLAVVATDIGDNAEAVTRFVQVAPADAPLPRPTGADKTSLVLFMKANRAGALLEILTELSVRGINMTRLESRPTRHALGDYCFSVDIEGHVAEARVGEALMGLRRAGAEVLFLGSYPRHDRRPPALPEGVADADFTEAEHWLAAIRNQ